MRGDQPIEAFSVNGDFTAEATVGLRCFGTERVRPENADEEVDALFIDWIGVRALSAVPKFGQCDREIAMPRPLC